MPFKKKVASRGQIRKEIKMTYVKIKCKHLYHDTHYSGVSDDMEFILNLNEIMFIKPYTYPSENAYFKEFMCEVALKGMDCQHHTILISQECYKQIEDTLKQMGELKKIVE